MADTDGNSSYTTKILLPIQMFLWRQSDAFFREKMSNLYKETCRTFEHMVVRNAIEGPPSLCDAVNAITRWQFVEACLPHVMHCLALYLGNRYDLGEEEELGVASTKLLHTLHWIFLESSNQCAAEGKQSDCVITLENICLFIHLFAPIVNCLKESDLTYQLANGRDIWTPMWNYESPLIPSFRNSVTSSEKKAEEPSKCSHCFDFQKSNNVDPIPVIVCDIAVISCLLNKRWHEDGVLWGINYILKKLLQSPEQAEQDGRLPYRRSRSMVDRRRSSSLLKSINFLPVQKEVVAETKLEESKSAGNLRDTLKDTKKYKKFASQHIFRGFQKKDDPPSYSVATSSHPFLPKIKPDRRKTFFGMTSRLKTRTDSETSFTIPPPKYADTITDTNDGIEIVFPSSDAAPSTSGFSQQHGDSNAVDTAETNEEVLQKRRWRSDTSLNYKRNEPVTSLVMLSQYVDANGSLRLDIILAVVDVIVANDPSSPLLEASLQVLICAYNRLEERKNDRKKCKRLQGKEAEKKENSCVETFLRILHNLTLIFGCTNPCCGHCDPTLEKMRIKTRHLLNTLFLLYRDHYQHHIETVMKSHSLRNITNFLHSLLSFCVVDVNTVTVNEVTDEALFLDSQNTNKLEDFVIKNSFRELVFMCVRLQSSLLSSENEDLYTEIRNIIQFVRIQHPSTFNEVLLTIMLIPTKKRWKWEQEKGEEKTAEKGEQLKKKMSAQELPKNFNCQRRGAVALTSSPLINSKSDDRKKQGLNYPSKTKDTPKGRTHATDSRLLSGSKKPFCCDSDSSDEDEMDEDKGRNRTQSVLGKILNKMTKDHSGISLNTKKPAEKETIAGMASNIKGSLISFFKIPVSEANSEDKKTEFEVEADDLCLGVKILQFLMNACPPGTVPEATVLGSVLGLCSPVICRFVVLLHCAQFVDRGINGNWPRWLTNRSFQRRSSVKDVKEHFYTAARIHFYRWGTEINKFLEKIIAVNNDPCKVLGNVTNLEDKLRYRNEDLNEDFLKDVRVNASGKECSIPLQMAASNLLYQITTFLRDTNQEMLNRKESCISTELGSKFDFTPATASASRCDENQSKKTIKFQHSSEYLHAPTLTLPGGSGLKRAASLLNDKQPLHKTEGRRGSATNASDEPRPSHKSHYYSSRKPSITISHNTLAVPPGNVLGGEQSSFASYAGDLSFGSTLSLGAASATSEYVKDMSEAVLSPNVCHSNLSSFHFGSLLGIDQSMRCKELPWMRSIIQLANQQNLLCDHIYFCHPFCHKRMIRSCNRVVGILKNTFDTYEKNKNDIAKFWGQSTYDFKDKYSKAVEQATHIHLSHYIKTKAQCLARSPLLTLMKAITTLSHEMLIDLHALSWEILLDSNKLLVEAAASLFLLCSIKIRFDVRSSVMAELNHKDPEQRINALRKIRVLWEYRKSVWKYAENNARESREAGFTFPAANSSFSFSISSLGLGSTVLPDPPWLPHIVDVDKMVAQRGASRSAALLTTDSLSYQKEQELKQLLLQEEEERSEARRNFQIINIPVVQQIVVEAKKKIGHEAEESMNETRRYSCRPVNTGINQSNTDFRKDTACRSTRSSIIHNLRSSHIDNINIENIPRPNSSVFPPSLGDCVPTIIQLISDVSTSQIGEQSVGSVASVVVTSCLNEDANLFLRSVAEKLLNKLERFKALRLLRKLPSMLPDLSPSVANSIFNQVIECIIHHNRASSSRERIIAPSAIAIASVFPFIESVDLKTMKQTLRKEQIDTQLLITAGFQGTKKLTVWNQGDYYMPAQIEVGDRSSFAHVLQEAMNLINVPESQYHLYQLKDRNNNQILCQHCYVRDFYMFKKSATNSESPEVELEKMSSDEGEEKLSHRVVELKLAEIGKLRFTIEGLFCQKNLTEKELNATYLQDEFKRLWSFPRKAIDGEFFLFDRKYGKEIQSLDAIQRYYWVELISSIMLSLSSEFPWENDLIFFLHVWNAALVVHSEHVTVLRRVMAAFIDAIVHFSRTFTFRGYSLILPSMLRVYCKHYKNGVIRRCLDFTFYQMFDVHRQPFLLQLFASAAPLLAEHNWRKKSKSDQQNELISPSNFFHLLLALAETKPVDELHVMSLVKAEKPLKPADKCLETDEVSIGFGDYFRLCVTVIAYQPENGTCMEMLIVLHSILPCYLQHIKAELSPDEEISRIQDVGIYFRFMLASVEALAKSINTSSPGQQQSQPPPPTPHSSIPTFFNFAKQGAMKTSENKLEDGKDKDENQENRPIIEEYIAPRDVLLQLCTTFYTNAVSRFSLLKKEDIFTAKSHIRLAEVAHSLLKLFTDENIAAVSFGLAFYMEQMLPAVDWSVEVNRPALYIVLKRMDRFLNKIDRNFAFRKNHDWTTLGMIFSGINTMISQQPVVTHVPHFKGIVSASIALQVGDAGSNDEHAVHLSPKITTKIMKLIVLYFQGSENSSLEDILSPLLPKMKRESIILNLFIPISLCTAADLPIDFQNENETKRIKLSMKLSTANVCYMISFCTNALMGRTSMNQSKNVANAMGAMMSLNGIDLHKYNCFGQRVLCLALKVFIACFHQQFHGEWQKLAKTMKQILYCHMTGPSIWNFVAFVMKYKTPLSVCLKAFMMKEFRKRPALEKKEQEEKGIFNEILLKQTYLPIRLSLIIKDFEEEAQELREVLLIGMANEKDKKAQQKSPNSIPKATNTTTEVQGNDRSRVASFREAVTPKQSPDALKCSGEYRKQRASLPVTKMQSRRSTPSPNRQVSKKSGMQNSVTVPGGNWSELNSFTRVPDIKIDEYETFNFATNSKSDQILRESISTTSKNSSSNAQTKERNRRVTISETTSFLSKPCNHQNFDHQNCTKDHEQANTAI